MEIQVMFDTIMAHLRDQNAKAQDEHGQCVYKYADIHHLSCAIGCLIPDELYDEHMEGNGVRTILGIYPKLGSYLEIGTFTYGQVNEKINFLEDMQIIHDEKSYPKRGWIKVAHAVGKKYGLQTNGR